MEIRVSICFIEISPLLKVEHLVSNARPAFKELSGKNLHG